ncbi:hypothetical protein G9A89_008031 [Geosiphon pyriformis]|nr:hypothetical protein G9A89_008031 [Geosiphon pyriformis]
MTSTKSDINREKLHDPWSPRNYSIHGNFVPILPHSDLISFLDAKPDEHILDIGCGDGTLTLHIQSICKECIGLDKSPRMIDASKKNGCRDVRIVDCELLEEWIEREGFVGKFDKVFSNAALHWMKDGESVIRGVRKCLKPGGLFVGEMGGYGNCQEIENALIAALNKRGFDGKSFSPWYFPTPESYSKLLIKETFHVKFINLIPRPTELPTSLSGWIETFGFAFLAPLSIEQREEVKREVEEMCRVVAYKETEEKWVIGYVRLRFVAELKDQ